MLSPQAHITVCYKLLDTVHRPSFDDDKDVYRFVELCALACAQYPCSTSRAHSTVMFVKETLQKEEKPQWR